MSEDWERDDDASTLDGIDEQIDRTALTNAVTEGVQSAMAIPPWRDLFGDRIARAAQDALKAASIGAWAFPADPLKGERFDVGLSSVVQAASDSFRQAVTGRAHDILGATSLSDIIGARDLVAPMDFLRDIHGTHLDLGLGLGAQAAMDAFKQRNDDLMGRSALADIIGPGTFTSPLDHLKGIQGPDFGIGYGAGEHAAMDAFGPRSSSTFDMLGRSGADPLAGFRTSIDAGMSDRWDLGNLLGGYGAGISDQLRHAALGAYPSAFDEMMRRSQHSIHEFMYGTSRFPEPSAWMNDLFREPAEAIAEMMRSLWPLADRGMRAAQSALRAALRIVRMLKCNDPKARDAVRDFLIEWLDFSDTTWDLVCSATLVLMNVGSWLPDNLLAGTFDPRPRLRALTLKEHRAVSRLSTDPRLSFRGKPLLSLDQPVKVSDADSSVTVLRDLVRDRTAPDPADVDDEAEIADPRIARLWWKFTDREREILREKSKPRVTWPAAAIACGGTAAEGERLRRKVRRLARADQVSEAPVRRATEAS
ncbi:hypothetical protein [Mycolicibacterium goodii]|uniref:hypothetical protein n=1 Tax=Mycolicibacterium goodii TaxID=134601 RepID=UPI00093DFFB4|nr:hypothetical protein [Mycolicibacterium goodii]MBU8840654.1 hypothetical protein [Mycolicibacterium goodii]OKH65375.1 hypothetical protein EB74_07070 [Mycobacterium sp. SWH-M5]